MDIQIRSNHEKLQFSPKEYSSTSLKVTTTKTKRKKLKHLFSVSITFPSQYLRILEL